jgi:hypothetical protein
MKRLSIILLFSLFAISYSPLAKVSAQEEPTFDFQRAYADYNYIYNQYRQTHAEYISARQAYLNYKTLTSKTEALNKTLAMLKLRDKSVQTYIMALRTKMAETTGISNYEENILYLKLDNEAGWYSQHYNSLPSAGSLEDLVASSKEAQDQYKKSEVLIYQTLGTILAGKETALRDKINQQIEILKAKIAEIRQRGDKDTAIMERWLLEATNRLTRSQEKEFTAQQLLAKMKSHQRDKNRVYNQAQFALEESHQYLKEANFYLKELIREAKHAD